MNIPRVSGRIGYAVQMVFDRLIAFLQRWLSLNVDAVANLAALAALDATAISNGNTKRVLTLRANFVLDKTSALAPDGITVVAAVGGGRWIRTAPDQPDEVWQAQTDWYIDAVAGNDENVGSTAPTAIKSWAEYGRRTGADSGAFLPAVTVTVNIVTDLPANDPLNVDCVVDPLGLVRVKGQLTTAEGPYVVGAYAYNPATNTPPTVTSTWAPASAVDKMILFTGGVAAGAAAWVWKDGGGGAGLTTVPTLLDGVGTATPAPGDTFIVVDMPTVYSRIITQATGSNIVPVSPFYVKGVTFQDVEFTIPANNIMTVRGDGGMQRCSFSGQSVEFRNVGSSDMDICRFSSAASLYASNIYMSGCLFRPGFRAVWSSKASFVNAIMTGASGWFLSDSYANVGPVGLFDNTQNPVFTLSFSQVSSTSASLLLYGTGNTGALVKLDYGSLWAAAAANPVVTTNATPYAVGAESYTAAELPRVDLKRNNAYVLSGTVPAQVFSFNVADPTALGLVPTTAVPNGTTAFVVSVREPFVLNTASAAVADGINVITAQDGGRWIRLGSTPISVGVAGNLTAGATRFALQNLTERATELPILATRAGNLRNLQCRLGVAPSGAESVQVTLFVNGVQTTAPIRATITGANTTAVDTTHLQAVAIGDRLSAQIVNSNLGGFAAADLSVSFEVS